MRLSFKFDAPSSSSDELTFNKSTDNEVFALGDCLSPKTDNDEQSATRVEELNTIPKCANDNCDKDGIKTCASCMSARYCSTTCQKLHWVNHKQQCKEIRLFKQPPPNEECPICCIPLPSLSTGKGYHACCGMVICNGCHYAGALGDDCNQKCPYCRAPVASGQEQLKRIEKRVELNDCQAIYSLACLYYNGQEGYPLDRAKAYALYLKAGKLGSPRSYSNVAMAYARGDGIPRNEKKAKHYYELAALGGHALSRYNLGIIAEREGDIDKAMKHYVIAAGCGSTDSFKRIQMFGSWKKDYYEEAVQAHQAFIKSISSHQRDEAIKEYGDYTNQDDKTRTIYPDGEER